MRRVLWGVLLFSVSVWLYAQDRAGGIIYGDNWAYMVPAPEGWVLDSSSWAQRGIHGLFYRKGTVPGPPNTIIYIKSMKLKKDTDEELDAFIAGDLEGYIADKRTRVAELKRRHVKHGKTVRVFRLDVKNRQFELIVYYRQKDTVHMIVLTAFGEEARRENEDAFFFIVDSLSFADFKMAD